MNRIEIALHEHHASLQQAEAMRATNAQHSSTYDSGAERTGEAQSELVETPFARVNSVADGSPAFTAGLKPGDGIRSFGDVNWMNHENLKRVAEVVQRNEGVRTPETWPSPPLTLRPSDQS